MPRCCIIKNCRKLNKEGITLHTIPDTAKNGDIWKSFIITFSGSIFPPISKFTRLCSRHFKPSSFIHIKRNRCVIPMHVPTLVVSANGETVDIGLDSLVSCGLRRVEDITPNIVSDLYDEALKLLQNIPINPEHFNGITNPSPSSDKVRRKCLFCGQLEINIQSARTKPGYFLSRKWSIDCSEAFCKLLELDPGKYGPSFRNAGFCESCHELFVDVLFLETSIQRFQERLKTIKEVSTSLLQTNYKHCLITASSPLEENDQNFINYLEAVKFIVSEIDRKLHQGTTEMEICTMTEEDHFRDVADFIEMGDDQHLDYDERENMKPPLPRNRQEFTSDSDWIPESEKVIPLSNRIPTFGSHGYKTQETQMEDSNIEIDEINGSMHRKDYIHIRKKLKELYGTDNTVTICHSLFPTRIDQSTGKKVKHACSQCSTSFFKEVQLSAHICQDHDNDEFPYHCNQCPSKLSTFSRLKSHTLREHVLLNIECETCHLALPTMDVFIKHYRAHREIELQKRCTKCNKKYTIEELLVHENLHDQKQNPFDCVLCDEKFDNQVHLEVHVSSKHPSNIFHCKLPDCSESFGSRGELGLHVNRIHIANPKYRCGICNIQFPNYQTISQHNLKHNNERPYKCTWPGCQRTYKQGIKVKEHVRRDHEGIRDANFRCHLCTKKFCTKDKLKTHIMHHGTERPFLCDQCAYAGKTKQCLWNHINYTHRIRDYGNIKARQPKIRNGIFQYRKSMYTPTGVASPRTKINETPVVQTEPCQVCGGQGGHAYDNGLVICRPCYAFHKTHIIKEPGEMKACLYGGNCQIVEAGNSNCIPCRFRKCTELGMTFEMSVVRVVESKSTRTGNVGSCKGCGTTTHVTCKGIHRCRACYTLCRKVKLKGLTFICKTGGNCVLTKENRTSCNFCRIKPYQIQG